MQHLTKEAIMACLILVDAHAEKVEADPIAIPGLARLQLPGATRVFVGEITPDEDLDESSTDVEEEED